MKSIISNLFPFCCASLRLCTSLTLFLSACVCLSLKMKANTSTLSLTIHMLSPHVWYAYGFEHLLFTLVFNLKFNLLKQLKAHTSQPKYTHSPKFTLAGIRICTRVCTHSKLFIRFCGISPTMEFLLCMSFQISTDNSFTQPYRKACQRIEWRWMDKKQR